MGGKYYLTDWLIQKIPRHTLYCEVFAGAAHLLFNKPESQVEVINDIDGHLINFFHVLQHPRKRKYLIRLLNGMLYSRQIWSILRQRWKAGDIPSGRTERAAQWYYLNRVTYCADMKKGGFAIPSTTGRNPVQSFRNAINDLDIVADRLKNVCVENLDYPECVKRYDSKDTLFYCDPPYYGSEHYYDRGNFAYDDHRTLSNLLHVVMGRAMVSHYRNDLYDELYRDWQRYEYQSFKGSHKSDGEAKPKITEILYCNFEPEIRTRSLFEGV